MSEKLQKVLARVGLGSRRFMEEVIAAGRVSVNGQVAELGMRVEVSDEIRVDGRKINHQEVEEIRRRVIVYYKPDGEICSRTDPEGRPTAFDQLPQLTNDRWVMVGRLDINSTGLLLFTNDGELANKLMHPSSEIERIYAVRVMGEVTLEARNNLLAGVELEDGPAKFDSFSEIGGEGINRWYQVSVREGRNREVRRLFETQGLKVSRLLRTRYGTVILPRELRTGRWMELDKHDIDALAKSVEMAPRQGTGLYGMAKRRVERQMENPLPARRTSYLRQSARTDGQQNTGENYYKSDRPQRTEKSSDAQPTSYNNAGYEQQLGADRANHNRGYRDLTADSRGSNNKGSRDSGSRISAGYSDRQPRFGR